MRRWYFFGFYTVFLAVVIVAAYLRLIPAELALIPMYDSIGHFVLYGTWFYLLHEALGRKVTTLLHKTIPTAFLILAPIIVLEECAQLLAASRTFSISDLAWGFAGMALVWMLRKE